MKKLLYIIFILLLSITTSYLSIPSPSFPNPPPDSVQSLEEGDTEITSQRRAYFTNYTREEVLNHYQNQLQPTIFGMKLSVYRLNYPPEDAYSIIRDQTRSSYLEEVVVPLRESLFVNGFIPTEAKDIIGYRGATYYQKITVKYATSATFLRVIILITALTSTVYILKEATYLLKSFTKP